MVFSQQACFQSMAVSSVSVSRAMFGGLFPCLSVGLDRLRAPQARCPGDQAAHCVGPCNVRTTLSVSM